MDSGNSLVADQITETILCSFALTTTRSEGTPILETLLIAWPI